MGKTSSCSAICGDSKRAIKEVCDNGNKIGCINCMPDAGYSCTNVIGANSTCTGICGDLMKAGGEECDNGNKLGCKNCKVDAGYTCTMASNGRTSKCKNIWFDLWKI